MTELTDLLPDGVVHLDAARRILAVNTALCRLVGQDRAALVGRPVAEALDPRTAEGRPVWEGGWHGSAQLRSTRALPEQEVTLKRADGALVPVLVTGCYQRAADGAVEGVVLAVRPTGARTHRAASGIEIVSTVSHELRSPLTSVKGFTSLLLSRWDRIPDDKKREMLEQVNHDADRVTRLITELLDISRLQTGRLVLRRQMVAIPTVVGSVVEKVGMEYPELDCTVSFPDDLPQVYADGDKVEQVLTNLVENACKYGSPKGLAITGEVDGDALAVSVRDQGEGIPEADLAKVFTKFFRREIGRPTGSGLGLWISRGLVEAHGGRLTVDSEVGSGTTFRFTLPLTSFEDLHR